MRSTPYLLAGTLVIVFLAGCLGDDASTSKGAAREKVVIDRGAHGHDAMMAMDDFNLQMKDCVEGGGVSLYNMQEGSTGPVTPFKRTSISDDTGNPMVASYGQPIPPGGATTGIWHTSVICKSYTFNGVAGTHPLEWGWVGVRIQPPPWDDSGIKRQYFVADFSLNDPEIVKALQRDLALHASRNLDTKVEWLAPMVLHTILDDEDHGVFETHGKMKDWKEMDTSTWRFWMLVSLDGVHAHGGEGLDESPGAGTKFKAVSFDVANSASDGKKATHMVVDGTAWLSHTRTDAHGAVAGAAGNVGGLLFSNFDRTITLGPSPDMTFDKTWLH